MDAPVANRAEKNKDVKYHSDYGRWVIWASKTKEAIEHLESIRINRNYVLANKQWDNKEDISNFKGYLYGQAYFIKMIDNTEGTSILEKLNELDWI